MYICVCMSILFLKYMCCAYLLSCVRLFAIPWILSVLPCPPSGDLPNSGIESRSPVLQVDSLPSQSPGKLPYPTSLVNSNSSYSRAATSRRPMKASSSPPCTVNHNRLLVLSKSWMKLLLSSQDPSPRHTIACLDHWNRLVPGFPMSTRPTIPNRSN